MPSLLKKIVSLLTCSCVLALAGCAGDSSSKRPWLGSIRHELGYLGARNWVVVSEAAFPTASRRGLRVIQVDADIPEVLEALEDVIEEKHHVKPRIYVTREIEKVPYDYAPGIKAHRADLKEALHGRQTVNLDHEILMSLINNTTKSYRVLVIKTRTALPYSSVFVELGSGYWDAESESALRKRMEE